LQCVAFFVEIKRFLYTYSSIWRMVTSKAKRSAAAQKAARTRKRNAAAKETARKIATAKRRRSIATKKRSVSTKKRSVSTKKRSATKRPVRKASKGKAARRTTRRK
jgi:type IV secretory pathway VirB6-like protein